MEMIKVSVFEESLPQKTSDVNAKEVKILPVGKALKEELVSRLFWGTRVHELSGGRVVIECPDCNPPEFVVFEDAGEEDALEALDKVAEWYAEATLLCSDEVFKTIKREVEYYRGLPLAPIER